jgi:group I intron endonuclease
MEMLLSEPIKFWGNNKELPDPELVLFYKELERREIWLDTEICWDNVSIIIKYINYINATAGDDMTPIILRIMSPGGELPSMFTLYHTIRDSRVPIHTINMGDCHSAAFPIFLAGAERSMVKGACFIAHEGSGMVGGTFRETKQAMKHYEQQIQVMRDIIVENTLFTTEEIQSRFESEQDFYIDEELAKKYKVVTNDLQIIYCITNKINNKLYIGKTNDFQRRKTEHLRRAFNHNDKSYDFPLYRAIREYGIENFEFAVLGRFVPEKINQKEQEFIQKFNTRQNGYNLTDGGEGGKTVEGVDCINAALTEEELRDIRLRMSYCFELVSEIYLDYNDIIEKNNFHKVCYGKSYKNSPTMELLTEEILEFHKKRCKFALTTREILDIRILKDKGVTKKDIYLKYQEKCGYSTFEKYYYGSRAPEITIEKAKQYNII